MEKDDDGYDDISTKMPEREVDELAEGNGKKTLIEKESETPSLSDMQTAIQKLFPEGLGTEVTNALMIARIAPSVFIPLLRILVIEELGKTDEAGPIKVGETVAKLYGLLSIGLEGKGRYDQIELAGATKDNEDLEKLGGLFSATG